MKFSNSMMTLFLATSAVAFSPASLPHRRHSNYKSFVLASTENAGDDATFDNDGSMQDDMIDNEGESQDDAPSDVEDLGMESKSTKMEFPSAANSESSVEGTLTTLLQIAASTGRGEFATQEQKEQAESLISILEAQNPTEEPAKSPLAVGRWELLYASTQLFRSSPFFMAGRAVCSTPEQAKQYDWFCDMHRKALAISSIGQVRQIISPTRMTSEFEVQVGAVPFLSDFTPFRYSGGWPVTIEGAIVSSADITPNVYGDAWELYMDTVEIKGSNIPGLRQVLDQGLKLSSRQLGDFLENNVDGYTNPRPVFKTTYLSDNLRISREQDGKVFVYGKLSYDSTPSDYSNVESDLGVLKLLEGFNDAVTKFYI
mmetsp:Transcript_916/g.2387  ORF Transcript_916/g.2387 Transcript_916/m.2387 type:complete len:371 (+) Transcript_916:85-1197(+)|eukprot:CAMPEP_0176023192 /NCGR_PEP_ID=MMETSP0120_2-20121206/11308_1 /TAXON_ID=160619 /ORGANISM="Kryptoperidinium foliaceum, Strain CCMP 1326" /LENGTH=370 /DNA_ID=CAMNT_0017356349 /DNA_START=57 /DNA_END=1169 /DNA_ORIENTATION=-